MRGRVFALLAVTAGLFALSISLYAHHGTGISYDRSKAFDVKAIVTEFRYVNPHPHIFFDVTEANGTVVHWGAEIAPNIAQLIRFGWSKQRSMEALKPGTPVTITVAPSRAGGTVGLIVKILNAKGEEVIGTNTPNQ